MRLRKTIAALISAIMVLTLVPLSALGVTLYVDTGEEGEYLGTLIMIQNADSSLLSADNDYSAQPVGTVTEIGEDEIEPAEPQASNGVAAVELPLLDIPSLADRPLNTTAIELPEEGVSYVVGDKKTIKNFDVLTSTYFDLEIELVAIGDTCTVWSAGGSITAEQAAIYAGNIDTYVMPVITESYGDPLTVDVDGDGKTAFAFVPMGGGVGGFFDNADIIPAEYGGNGNLMDMLHISSIFAGSSDPENYVMQITSHELTHLIVAGTAGFNRETWLNEVFAQSAILLYLRQFGDSFENSEVSLYIESVFDYYNENGSTVPFAFSGYFVPRDSLSTLVYGQWLLFGQYIMHQTKGYAGGGDGIFKAILENGECSFDALMGTLADFGYNSATSKEKLIENYNASLLIRMDSGVYSIGVELPYEYSNFPTEAPQTLRGGGSATFYASSTGMVATEGAGADIGFIGLDFKLTPPDFSSEQQLQVYGAQIELSSFDDAAIYYTTDGSEPTAETGTLYTDPIVLTENCTVTAIAYDESFGSSEPGECIYFVQPELVQASVHEGNVPAGTEIALSCATPNAFILYTTDGSEPLRSNEKALRYSAPIVIGEDEKLTLRAAAYMEETDDRYASGYSKTFVYTTADPAADRYEFNDTTGAATSVSFPTRFDSVIYNEADVDVYKFSVSSEAALELSLAVPAGRCYSLELLYADGTVMKRSARKSDQSISIGVSKGDYFVRVAGMNGTYSDAQPYTLRLSRKIADASKLDYSEMSLLGATFGEGSPMHHYADAGIGGYERYAVSYYMNWQGPVLESAQPYVDKESAIKYQRGSSQYDIQNMLQLPYMHGNDHESYAPVFKNAIMTYGAVGFDFMVNLIYFDDSYTNYYMPRDPQYKVNGQGGHAVTLVGWDDNYPKENFIGNAERAKNYGYANAVPEQPEHDGAWILKNSWGTDFGDDGYFYISYENFFMGYNEMFAFIVEDEPQSFNKQYANDTYGWENPYAFSGAATLSQTFRTGDEPEELAAVSMLFLTSNTEYEYYLTIGDGEKTPIMQGVKTNGGYYTERLAEPIALPANTNFTISIRFQNTDPTRQVYFGATDTNDRVFDTDVEAIAGMALAENEGDKQDLGAMRIYPCLRAFTNNAKDEYVGVAFKTAKGYLKDSAAQSAGAQLATLASATEAPEGYDGSAVRWSNYALNNSVAFSDESLPASFDLRDSGILTPVKNQGALGSCWTFATTASVESSVAKNFVSYDYPTGLTISESSVTAKRSESVSLRADITGADSPASRKIYWSYSGDLDAIEILANVSDSGEAAELFRFIGDGRVTVTATCDADITKTATCAATAYRDGFTKIDGRWYYGEGGAYVTGLHKLTGYGKGGVLTENYYLFDGDGAMLTGFVKHQGQWRYFGEAGTSPFTSSLGAMAVNCYVKSPASGYRTAAEVAAGRTYNYYFDGMGALYTGWHKDALTRGCWMYFGEAGTNPATSRLGRQARYGVVAATGNGGERHEYLFSKTGVLKTGTYVLNGVSVYFNERGVNPATDLLGAKMK